MRPTIYNRPWHMDADDRRHHGRRRWEPGVVEALVEVIGAIDGVYPPDWSERDVVRFRAAGAGEAFVELWTDKPSVLRLLVHAAAPPKLALEGCRIHRSDGSCEMLLKSTEPLRAEALKELLRKAAAESIRTSPRG